MKKSLLYILISFLLLSCSDSDNKEAPIIESIVRVDKSEIQFEQEGGQTTLKVTANTSWKATDIPTWVTLSIDESSKPEDVIITVTKNETQVERSAIILFTGGDKKVNLPIYQDADEDEISWVTFISTLTRFDVSYEFGADGISRTYTFDRFAMFALPELQEKIFLGNLVNRFMDGPTKITDYAGFTFNKSNISSSSPSIASSEYTPSYNAQKEYLDKAIANKPKQSGGFSWGQIKYDSRRELNLLGMGNLGLALDELISGKSYKEKEMTKKFGYIDLYNQSLFSIDMDQPDPRLIQEELKTSDYPDESLAYISSVEYGRIGMLIIESDSEFKDIRALLSKVSNKEALNAVDNTLLNTLDAYNIYFDKQYKIVVNKGKLDAIQSYYSQAEKDPLEYSFIYQFHLADYFSNGMTPVNYKVQLP